MFDANPNLMRVRGKVFRLTFGMWQYRWTTETTVFGNCSGFDNLSCAIANIADELPAEDGCVCMKLHSVDGKELVCDVEDDDIEYWLSQYLICAEIIDFAEEEVL